MLRARVSALSHGSELSHGRRAALPLFIRTAMLHVAEGAVLATTTTTTTTTTIITTTAATIAII